MSFLDLIGFDKEAATKETIQVALENIREELNCPEEDFFLMIKPRKAKQSKAMNEKVADGIIEDFGCWIYQLENGVPKCIREITVKEIISEDE